MKTYKVKLAGNRRRISSDEIMLIEAAENYSIICLHSGKRLIVARTLKKYEEELHQQFFRVNRSALINLRCIQQSFDDQVLLSNGQQLTISRRRLNRFNLKTNQTV